jgi:UTP--glucose-1-phosphate uridylyltransferase
MPQRIYKAIFPAGGLGTRMLPATKAIPKEMLPLVDKPLIQYVVEEAGVSGIESIVIVIRPGKDVIADHFDFSIKSKNLSHAPSQINAFEELRDLAKRVQISYVQQEQALGVGHAILQAREMIGNEPFAVLLPDGIIDADVFPLQHMFKVYEKYDAPVLCVTQMEGEIISRYGVVLAEEFAEGILKVIDVIEKPPLGSTLSNMAAIGRYILTPDIFDELELTSPGVNGEIQLMDAMRSLLKKRPFYAVRLMGRRYDAGDKLGLIIATIDFALKRPDLAPGLSKHLLSLQLLGKADTT